MFTKRSGAVYIYMLFCLILLASCTGSPPSITTPTPTRTVAAIPTASPVLSQSSTPDTTPAHYTSHVLLSGVGRPDDLAFDRQGHLLFSDFFNGTVSRLNTDGSVTVLVRGVAGEAAVFLDRPPIAITAYSQNHSIDFHRALLTSYPDEGQYF